MGKIILRFGLNSKLPSKKHQQSSNIEQEDIIAEPNVPVLDKLRLAINNHNLDLLIKLYSDDAILVPAFSTKLRIGKSQIHSFFKDFFEKDDIRITLYQVNTQKTDGLKVDNGMYVLRWKNHGFEKQEHIRFSLVIKEGKIVTHHASIEPLYQELVKELPQAYAGDFV